ncbi:5'-AMP-activated protein kinase subunit beta-2 [Smittium mucronatum]|uniref:5'-AMP-activated protein kinase subunit beta-2 n=1 Tax=Smittium mucronatum TaxID=133383 RepID=A0A1R0H8N8_9FUNG|nr:5'-AMP-activated protein kinase subunit beta-2 [Smittium mucronatum]
MGNTNSTERKPNSRASSASAKSGGEFQEGSRSPKLSDKLSYRRLRTPSLSSSGNKRVQRSSNIPNNLDDGIFGLGMASGSPIVGSPLHSGLGFNSSGLSQGQKRTTFKGPQDIFNQQRNSASINIDIFPETYADQSGIASYINSANRQSFNTFLSSESPSGMDIEPSKKKYPEAIVPTLIKWEELAESVYVSGSFIDWKYKIKLTKSDDGEWSTLLNLPVGMHRLKFIVDGEWQYSNNLVIAPDDNGNLVNYIKIEDVIINMNGENEASDNVEGLDNVSLSDSPPGNYKCVMPDPISNRSSYDSRSQRVDPPHLPPHLNNVLLNQTETNINGIRSLPPPNHVVLNHLYACSIKDNVMAVSSTTRYRKKSYTYELTNFGLIVLDHRLLQARIIVLLTSCPH